MSNEKRLSELSSKELESLHGDTIQMAQSGTLEQRMGAEDLLPMIGAEVERRIKTLRARQEAGRR